MRGFGGHAELFQTATGFAPYPYQTDFATQPKLASLLSVPTGCGKTAAVIERAMPPGLHQKMKTELRNTS